VDLFWVSSTAASFDSNSWSTASGGPPGAPVPGHADTAYFDNNGSGDCTIDGSALVYGLNMGPGYSGTLYPAEFCSVLRLLNLSGGILGDGTVSVYGDVSCNLGFGDFLSNQSTSIRFTGDGKQSLFSNGGVLPSVEVDKTTSNQVKVFGDYPIYFSGDFLIHDGTFHTNGHDIISGPGPSGLPFFDVDFDWELYSI
jgi:hypothetical protein